MSFNQQYDAMKKYQIILLLIMPFFLSWPAWLNGQPFFFQDTTAYMKGAASAAEVLGFSNSANVWLHPHLANVSIPSAEHDDLALQAEKYTSSPDKNGVIAGRSIYYGFFIFVIASLFGIAIIPLVQALISIALIATVSRSLFKASYRTVVLIAFILAIASPLPFFNSLLMPDVFAGLGIAALLALLLSRNAAIKTQVLWGGLVAAAALFHTGNVLILLAATGVMSLFALNVTKTINIPKKFIFISFMLIASGVVGDIIFGYCVKHFTDDSPIRPPFMSARLIADGPGKTYINEKCPQADFEICHYKNKLHEQTSDDLLWSLKEDIGVFTLASKVSRNNLSKQDFSFAKAVAFEYPWQVLRTSWINVQSQLVYIGLEEFRYNTTIVNGFLYKLPDTIYTAMKNSRAAKNEFDVHPYEQIIKIGVVLSLLACIFTIRILIRMKKFHQAWFLIAVLISILINAVVCGVLSTPHDRYQARVIWLIEFIALASLFHIWQLRLNQKASGHMHDF